MLGSSFPRTPSRSSPIHETKDRVTSCRPAVWFVLAGLFLAIPARATEYEFQWKNPIPQGNALYAMAFEDSLVGYAVGAKGTCMKTTDGGQTWIDQTSFPGFAKDLRDVLVRGPADLIAVGETPGIFRSLDGGLSWIAVSNPSTETLNNIEVISGDTLSVVGDGGRVLHSTDGGGTWTSLPGPGDFQVFDQFWWDSQTGYVVGEIVARQTADGGQTWDPIPDVPEAWVYNKIHFLDSQNGWLLQQFNTFRTTDGGASWFERHGPHLEAPFYQEEVVFFDMSHRIIVVSLEGAEIWETTDDGESWTQIYSRERSFGYTDIERLADSSLVVCSRFGDLLRSTDAGQTWVNFTQSPEDGDRSTLQVMAVLPDGTVFAGGDNASWLQGTIDGSPWRIPAASPDVDFAMAVRFRGNDFGLVGGPKASQPSRVCRTTDGGESWTTHDLAGGNVGASRSIAIPDDSTCYTVTFGGATENHVFRSLDGGQSWSEITHEIPTTGRLEAVFFVDADTGFVAGGTAGAANGDPSLWKTVDGGDSWTPVSASSIGGHIFDMYWMSSSTGIVASRNGTYRTTDGGSSWVQVLSRNSRDVDFSDDLHGVIVGFVQVGLNVTSDGGLTWEQVEYPWENAPQAAACLPDGFLVCGTGSAVLRGRDVSATGVSDDSLPGAGSVSSLVKVMPNPFNPTARIHFIVPVAGHLRLAVYDVGGRRVAALISRSYPAGEFEATWDGKDDLGRPLASGVYFVSLEGRGFSATTKLLLLK
jgi:photosystem II stability/assembly factor-like uncharacterized protein